MTNDGRIFEGRLEGCDAQCNVVLADSHERVFDASRATETVAQGLLLLRGDNLALVGLVSSLVVDYGQVVAAPLKPIVH
jgi:U6 snRNA-associated Sm-like protein LSm8